MVEKPKLKTNPIAIGPRMASMAPGAEFLTGRSNNELAIL